MRWKEFFGIRPKSLPIWAALCTGRADGSNPKYLAEAKRAILIMVRAAEPQVESAVIALLQLNGWHEPEIQNLKMLAEPFHSDDPFMRTCHAGANKGTGGIVVYSDPIEGA